MRAPGHGKESNVLTADMAVLSGTFARSSRTTPADIDACFDHLSDASAELARWLGTDPLLTRFQGHRWEMLLKRPGLFLRSALYIQALMKMRGTGAAVRLAAGIGTVETAGTRDLSDADGPAFSRARRALMEMKRGRRICLEREGARPPSATLVTLSDALCQRWTAAQAEALVYALRPDAPTQNEIAERLGTRQQNVAARLNAAGFWALADAIRAIETVYPHQNQL